MFNWFCRKPKVVDDGRHEKQAAIKKTFETSETIRKQLAQMREDLETTRGGTTASQMS